MKAGKKPRALRGDGKRYLLTLALLVFAVALLIYGEGAGARRRKLDYAYSLDEVAAVVNGNPLTLRRLAYYVAYEEALVEEQAVIYNPENPNEYWNTHITAGTESLFGNFSIAAESTYIRTAARKAAIQMAVHDEVFAQLAEADGVSLTEEEKAALAFEEENFWQDLVEDEKVERLGVSYEDICGSMERAALGQKYQAIYELLRDAGEGAYGVGEEDYEALLEEQDYEIDEELWKRVDFGNVTLDHGK